MENTMTTEGKMIEASAFKPETICSGCGRTDVKIKAKGLCSTCYKKSLEEEFAPLPGEGILTVDFALAPDILRELQRRADDEMRPLGNQVVWELKRAMGQ